MRALNRGRRRPQILSLRLILGILLCRVLDANLSVTAKLLTNRGRLRSIGRSILSWCRLTLLRRLNAPISMMIAALNVLLVHLL